MAVSKVVRPVSYLAFSVLVAALLARQLHVPLPENWTERNKMTALDIVLRLIYAYPVRYLALLGSEHQMFWTRYIMGFNARMLSPWSLIDPDMHITDTKIAGVPVRTYVPKQNRASDGAIIFIHGGGFVIGDVAGYEGITRQIAKVSRMVTLSIDYRLAPEHVFPAGLEDCERVVAAFLAHEHKQFNVDPSKVIVMGDSAGGNLATVVAQRLRKRQDLPKLKGQVLLYPFLQMHDLHLPSYQQYRQEYSQTSFLDPEQLVRGMLFYLGIDAHATNMQRVLDNTHTGHILHDLAPILGHDLLPEEFLSSTSYTGPRVPEQHSELHDVLAPYLYNPDFSPLMQSDLRGMPATMVATCEYDILRDEGILYAIRLRNQDVPVRWQHYDGGFHAMLNLPNLELGQQMVADAVEFALDLTAAR